MGFSIVQWYAYVVRTSKMEWAPQQDGGGDRGRHWGKGVAMLAVYDVHPTGNACPVDPSIANQHASMSTSCSTSHGHGQMCTLLCSDGYTKSGDLTCTAGSWDAPACDGMARLCWSWY